MQLESLSQIFVSTSLRSSIGLAPTHSPWTGLANLCIDAIGECVGPGRQILLAPAMADAFAVKLASNLPLDATAFVMGIGDDSVRFHAEFRCDGRTLASGELAFQIDGQAGTWCAQ